MILVGLQLKLQTNYTADFYS